jgi:hypothetical protein
MKKGNVWRVNQIPDLFDNIEKIVIFQYRGAKGLCGSTAKVHIS